MKAHGLVVLLLLVLMAALPLAAHAQLPASKRHADHVPGELIVKFESSVPAAERTDALRERGARRKRSLPTAGTVLARIPAGTSVQRAVSGLERDPRVAWAEPNSYQQGAANPNDPFFGELWGMGKVRAPQAWDRTTGSSGVKVAVIDSGVNLGQPDLAPNLWRNPGESGGGREHNGVDDDRNGYVDDYRGWDFVQRDGDPSDNHGHGTHVAGTVAARGDNALGVTGVAWRASIIPLRVLDNVNSGSCADGAAAMTYAARAGARVVNFSITSRGPCQAQREAIERAPGTLFVVAAGNDGADVDSEPRYPCAYPSPNIVCVAATDVDDGLAGFSNYGASSVDLAAPGVHVLSSHVKFGPRETLFTDGFETPLAGRWVTGGTPNTWDRTPFVEVRSGGFSLSNSILGYYANNTDNWARLTQGLDLRNKRDCAAVVWATLSLGTHDPGRPYDQQDRLIAETAPDGVEWGRNSDALAGTGTVAGWIVDLSQLEGRSTGGLRFRLVTDASGTFGGVALDDLSVICVPPLTSYTGARDEFEFDDGTSMAAPHVSGTAVLLLAADPHLPAAELKRRLLSTADPRPSLAGRTVSGGRLNAARAVELSGRPGGAGRAHGVTGDAPTAMASTLAADLRTLVKSLKRIRIRRLLRRGRLAAVPLRALAAGRFTLKLRSAAGRTIARGACSARRPGRCRLAARLTRSGRAFLRRARRRRVTAVLSFKPSTGPAVARRTTVTLGR